MYEFVSWDDEIPNWMEKYKTCSKPPTIITIHQTLFLFICTSNQTNYVSHSPPESASFTSIQLVVELSACCDKWGDKSLDESVSWGWPYSELNGLHHVTSRIWWYLSHIACILAGADSVPLPLVFFVQQGRMDCAWTVWKPQMASWYRRSWWVGCVWNCGIPIHYIPYLGKPMGLPRKTDGFTWINMATWVKNL